MDCVGFHECGSFYVFPIKVPIGIGCLSQRYGMIGILENLKWEKGESFGERTYKLVLTTIFTGACALLVYIPFGIAKDLKRVEQVSDWCEARNYSVGYLRGSRVCLGFERQVFLPDVE